MKLKIFLSILVIGAMGLVGLLFIFSKVKNAPAVQQLSTGESVTQAVTLAELSQHSSEQDCWVAYKGEVFNITWFIPQHEGGLQIVSLCGQQADEFSQQHPGGSFDKAKIQAVLRVSKVGSLTEK